VAKPYPNTMKLLPQLEVDVSILKHIDF